MAMRRLTILLIGLCGGFAAAACQPQVGMPRVPAPESTTTTTTTTVVGPASDTNAAWLNEDGTITCPLDHVEEGGTCIPEGS